MARRMYTVSNEGKIEYDLDLDLNVDIRPKNSKKRPGRRAPRGCQGNRQQRR